MGKRFKSKKIIRNIKIFVKLLNSRATLTRNDLSVVRQGEGMSIAIELQI